MEKDVRVWGGLCGSSWGQMMLDLVLTINRNLFLGSMPTFWVGFLPEPLQAVAAAAWCDWWASPAWENVLQHHEDVTLAWRFWLILLNAGCRGIPWGREWHKKKKTKQKRNISMKVKPDFPFSQLLMNNALASWVGRVSLALNDCGQGEATLFLRGDGCMEGGWPWAPSVSAQLDLAGERGVARGTGILWWTRVEGYCFHPCSLDRFLHVTQGIIQWAGLTGWQQLPASSLYSACFALVGFPSAPAKCLLLNRSVSLVPSQGFTALGLFWPSAWGKVWAIIGYWLVEAMKSRSVWAKHLHAQWC